ncbi:MAG: carboxypeptidase-like regulatory domain-containing protein [Rhodothermales bacterium]|nr:carboxypeptidase-like regulatory domain-containing protein [Rhodothermales bacterium]
MLRALALLGCLLLVEPAFAQSGGGARISGQVTHAETGEPIGGVHVFISGSTAGTISGPDGLFELNAIPLGANRIVVSSVGYRRQGHDVVVRRPIGFSMDFALEPEVVPLEEITVTGELDPRWPEQLEAFQREFLGFTARAAESRIANPEILDFAEVNGVLRARAEGPLVVENRALGYRILYFLQAFESRGRETRQEGEALFSELDPKTPEQLEEWAQARREAYLGSSRHLFRQLFREQTKEAGFFLYSSDEPRPPREAAPYRQNQAAPIQRPQFAMRPADLVSEGPSPRERLVSFPKYVEVVYTKEDESATYRRWQGLPEPLRPDYQRSWVRLTRESVLVDTDGSILDAYGVVFYGHMAYERLADLVPREYAPAVTDS